jgi:hypothetical protein
MDISKMNLSQVIILHFKMLLLKPKAGTELINMITLKQLFNQEDKNGLCMVRIDQIHQISIKVLSVIAGCLLPSLPLPKNEVLSRKSSTTSTHDFIQQMVDL